MKNISYHVEETHRDVDKRLKTKYRGVASSSMA